MAVKWGYKLLLVLTFCIYVVREILFLSEKSQEKVREKSRNFETYACDNHAKDTSSVRPIWQQTSKLSNQEMS